MRFELPLIELPDMPLELPESTGIPDVNVFRNLKDELESRIINGQLVNGHVRGIEELERRILSGLTSPSDLIGNARDIRLLVGWWRVNGGSNNAAPFNRRFLRQFNAIRPRLSVQALFGLIEVYFNEFDQLEDLNPLGRYLRDQLERRANRALSGRLSLLLKNRDLLFEHQAPKNIAGLATSMGRPLVVIMSDHGVVESQGRFFDCCQQVYYLETLKGLKVGEEHNILAELAQKTVYESAFGKGFQLGHEVIKQMINMASGVPELPDNWLRLILEIAGDPRVNQSSKQFTRWWSRLDQEYVTQVRRWLSRMDLSMFLEILEDYSANASEEMRRMFPARKKFLLGLFESELIKDSRLYLSRSASRYVRQHYRGKEMPAFAQNTDYDRSVLYVNVDGYHVFEGTHNFYFWIHKNLPKRDNPVTDYKTNEFYIRRLGLGLNERLISEGESSSFHVSHNGDWQYKVIREFKRLGIKIDPSKVFAKDDYKIYKRRYGV